MHGVSYRLLWIYWGSKIGSRGKGETVRRLLIALTIVLAAAPAQGQKQPQEPTTTSREAAARAAAARAAQRATATDKLERMDGNPTLFAVLAAINAAGYDTDIDSPSNNPLRKQLREFLASRKIPSLPELRRFVRDHHLADPGQDLGQYISFALLSKGAPDFKPANENLTPPADADRLHDLPPLLAKFYQEGEIADLWARSQPAYEAAISQYTEPVAYAVQSVNGYFRNAMNVQTRGRFQVFIDLLGAPNQAQSRTYIDEYFVVVTPSAQLRVDEIRHEYLRFWADGLRFKFIPEITRLRPLGDFAQGAPALGEEYKNDFLLLTTECLVKAIESRLSKKPELAAQAAREGFVLTPVFTELLAKYEAQPDTLRGFFPEMLKAVDLKKETARLDKVDFVKEQTVKTVRVTVEAKEPELTGVAKTLNDAEDAFRTKNFAAAKETWQGLLATSAEKPVQARAYYGLGRVALAERSPERADLLFRKVLDLEPDGSTLSWTLLYLGKLSDSQGDRDPAQEFYRRALAVTGLPDQVKREAEQGAKGAFYRARPEGAGPAGAGPDDDNDEDDEDDLP